MLLLLGVVYKLRARCMMLPKNVEYILSGECVRLSMKGDGWGGSGARWLGESQKASSSTNEIGLLESN